MELEWMGRYRELLAALVYYGNMTSRNSSVRIPQGEGIALNAVEFQTLEYLLEHEDDTGCMSRVAADLGIPQSSISKIIKSLCNQGLVARYRLPGNRKNVIPRPTDMGREIYLSVSERMKNGPHVPFFERLDAFDDETINCFAAALYELTNRTYGSLDPQPLIPMD